MVLLFARFCRAYFADGISSPETPGQVEIASLRRIQSSDRRMLVRHIYLHLEEQPERPDTPFQAAGDTGPMISANAISEEWRMDLFHVGFAIFRTETGFVLRTLKRIKPCVWADAPAVALNQRFKPDDPIETVATVAADNLLAALRKQKLRRISLRRERFLI